jgi:hypothetical protein
VAFFVIFLVVFIMVVVMFILVLVMILVVIGIVMPGIEFTGKVRILAVLAGVNLGVLRLIIVDRLVLPGGFLVLLVRGIDIREFGFGKFRLGVGLPGLIRQRQFLLLRAFSGLGRRIVLGGIGFR